MIHFIWFHNVDKIKKSSEYRQELLEKTNTFVFYKRQNILKLKDSNLDLEAIENTLKKRN